MALHMSLISLNFYLHLIGMDGGETATSEPPAVTEKSRPGRYAGTDISDMCISCRKTLTKVIYSQGAEIKDTDEPDTGVLGE